MASVSVFNTTRFTALASGDVLPGVDISDTTQSAHGSLDSITVTNFFATIPVPVVVASASASAFAVGLTGATNSAFLVDCSTALQVAGLKITGAVTGGTVALVTTDSGAATSLTINAKGIGTIGIGSVSTGRVTITPVTTITGALTLSATLGAAAANFSGNVVVNSAITLASTGAGSGFTTLSGSGAVSGFTGASFTLNQNATTEVSLNNSDATNSTSRSQFKTVSATVQGQFVAIAGTQVTFGSISSHPVTINTNGTTAISISTAQASTFANTLTVTTGGLTVSAGTTAVQALTATTIRAGSGTGTLTTGDLQARRGAADGVVYFGDVAGANDHYVHWNGATFQLGDGPDPLKIAGLTATTGVFVGQVNVTTAMLRLDNAQALRGLNAGVSTTYHIAGISAADKVSIDADARGTVFGAGISCTTVTASGDLSVATTKKLATNAGLTNYFAEDGGGALGVYVASTLVATWPAGGLTLVGNITTGAPSGGAGAWRLGSASVVSPTSPNRTLEISINGTVYYIHAKTTNN